MLIHDALNDYLTCGETAVPAHELRRKITDLEAPMQDKEVTGFQSEFDVSISHKTIEGIVSCNNYVHHMSSICCIIFLFILQILNSVSKNVCSEDILYSQESAIAWKNRYKNRFPCELKPNSTCYIFKH